jgi:enoyl-CoA hydratase/carnithine racemase
MSTVSIRRETALLHIELNRPDRANSLSEELVEELLSALAPEETVGVRLAVFSGRGANFCAGFDLSDLRDSTDAALLWRLVRLETMLQVVFHAPFMTLALAHGNAIGAGADLFCACAMRVAAPGTTFRMPGLKFGVALGTRRLANRIGSENARDLLLESKWFDADRGHEVGFVHEVAPQAEWHAVQERAVLTTSMLPRDSVSHLLELTTRDTRDADFSALVRSASRPGLRERILAYLKTVGERPKTGGKAA